jgi:alkylation response protein AidB-like acyl-CoA dehydrogenase
MTVARLLDPFATDLLGLVRHVADAELAPFAAKSEEAAEFPRDRLRTLGDAGLLGMPFPTTVGGGGVLYEVYLQLLEEVAQRWLTPALAMSVHTLSCTPLLQHGDDAVRALLPELLAGRRLGAFCLSEPQAGSDVAAITTTARPVDGGFALDGAKAWITHGGVADSYTVFARMAGTARSSDSHPTLGCFVVRAGSDGLSFGPPERKMGLTASPTTPMYLHDVFVPADRVVGEPGNGLHIALDALDAGRLGIAACAIGLAQSALDLAVEHTRNRRQFGRPLIDFQGLAFMLADCDAAIVAARATYIDAARRKDAGLDHRHAAAVAKLVATDAAMKVTTDAVQALGGYGYSSDHPAERYMREAKVLQIFEGTNQIQRVVIARDLARVGYEPVPKAFVSKPSLSAGSSSVTTSSGRSRSTSST